MENATLTDHVETLLVETPVGSTDTVLDSLHTQGVDVSRRHLTRLLDDLFRQPPLVDLEAVVDHEGHRVNTLLVEPLIDHAKRSGSRLMIGHVATVSGREFVVINDRRGTRWWATTDGGHDAPAAIGHIQALIDLPLIVVPHGKLRLLVDQATAPADVLVADFMHRPLPYSPERFDESASAPDHPHLAALEAESIRIIREAVSAATKPAMLFSLGKDSMVMWTLAKKAFWPEPPPIPLALIDSRWEFQEVYRVRDYIDSQPGTQFLVHTNPEAITLDVNPFDFGSAGHTDITRTQGLRQFLDANRFDFVFGGGRRDEERSRAKERVFSIRNANHGWDPKAQRPELWNVYNTVVPRGQSMRVFPLSNWTELDVWRYIQQHNVPVAPLYFSKVRPFVQRQGALIAVDDERFRLDDGERVYFEPIRFRTLGCYPLTGGERSEASSVADIIAELETTRVSERSSRVIDSDPGASMEQKKKEGYF